MTIMFHISKWIDSGREELSSNRHSRKVENNHNEKFEKLFSFSSFVEQDKKSR